MCECEALSLCGDHHGTLKHRVTAVAVCQTSEQS